MNPAGRRMAAALRRQPAVRLLYAGAVAARILGGYRLLRLRRWLRIGPEDYEEAVRAQHRAGAMRVYRGVVRLQGLMIKIGQTLGANPAAVPVEYVTVLSRLQDAVPPRPWREMRPAIERALGRRIEDTFADFDHRPVGAASLAQVYRATLKDGRAVAVKVLYPGIERLVRSDLRVLRLLLWLDARAGGYPLEPIYQELARNVPLEVDLVHEGRAMERMAALLHDQPRVQLPRVIWELTSRRLLVMDWLEGIKVTEGRRLRDAGIDVQQVAELLTDTYCRMVLREGFFHADPHPGNLFALPGNRLGIVDFGLTKELTPGFRQAVARLTRAMVVGDVAATVAAFAAIGFAVRREDDHAVFLATAEFFRNITDPRTYRDGADSMRNLNERWARAAKANPFIAIPGDLTLVSRVFSLLTGVGAGMAAEPRVMETVLRYTAGIDDSS